MIAIAAPPFRCLLTNTTDPGMKANANERRKGVVGPCRHDKQAFGFSPKTGSEAWYILEYNFQCFWWTTW